MDLLLFNSLSMRVSDFQTLVPNPPVLPGSINAEDPQAIENYLYSLLLHAARVERIQNEGLPRGERENRFSVGVNDDGQLRATLTAQADLTTLQLA
jgi:hypothetical protein